MCRHWRPPSLVSDVSETLPKSIPCARTMTTVDDIQNGLHRVRGSHAVWPVSQHLPAGGRRLVRRPSSCSRTPRRRKSVLSGIGQDKGQTGWAYRPNLFGGTQVLPSIRFGLYRMSSGFGRSLPKTALNKYFLTPPTPISAIEFLYSPLSINGPVVNKICTES